MVGQTVSHYKILEKLGEGALGTVYKAQDTNLDRLVVLKFLPPELVQDEKTKARFIREAKAASALDHRNICTFYGLEQAEAGHLFISMAYYEGETLKEKMKAGPLPLDLVTSLTTQIAEGLSQVHKRGIVHRNIKPENIFVTVDGTAKILDFGLAKLESSSGFTSAGGILGSPCYMSPEQLRGEKVDHRTDVWSLGVLMYGMITGQKPFEAPLAETLLYMITRTEPPLLSQSRPEVPPKWEQVVRKALTKNVYQRYQQVDELLGDLRELIPAARGATLLAGSQRPGASAQPKLGMAYVLFMDLVAYSTLMTDEQGKIIEELSQVVQSTEQFRESKEADQLILLPTGDGMALVFFDDLMAPAECAVQVARALSSHPKLKLRMGVHSGPVYRTIDISQARNVAGGGINLAQRVMDCGDAGHILVSKSYADFLDQLGDWRQHVHELGVLEVKHGVPVHLFNVYSADFGNPEMPKKFAASGVPVPAQEPSAKPAEAAATAPAHVARKGRSLTATLGIAAGAVRQILRRQPREAYVEVVSGPQEGSRFPINKSVIRLGAFSQEDGGRLNDIVLSDRERLISRFHCEIHRHGNKFFLLDPGSVNGTFLDGHKLETGKPVQLNPGAEMDLAHRCTLRVGLEPRKP